MAKKAVRVLESETVLATTRDLWKYIKEPAAVWTWQCGSTSRLRSTTNSQVVNQHEAQEATTNRNSRSHPGDIQTESVYHYDNYHDFSLGEEMKVENEEVQERGNIPHEPASHINCEDLLTKNGDDQESEMVQLQLRVPQDIKKIIKDNGGAGFVVGLVRSVMR